MIFNLIKRISIVLLLSSFSLSISAYGYDLIAAVASNLSTTTQCAEEDNINIPFVSDRIQSWFLEASHPAYDIGQDNCDPDFTNCPPPNQGFSFVPLIEELFNDGNVIIEAVREEKWWLPVGMEVSVDDEPKQSDIHYLRISQKIIDANEWPQFLVLYMDGNLRLIPHPPIGKTRVCYGSSVIVGPAQTAARPLSQIVAAKYLSAIRRIEISYLSGGKAFIDLERVDRTKSRIKITVDYPTNIPFATFRSMYVKNGNADVDSVNWLDAINNPYNFSIMSFTGGEGIEWSFYRKDYSQHNTSAPNIKILLLHTHTLVGVFRAGSWFLDANGNGAWDRCQQDGGLDLCHSFGTVGDLPAAGNWDGEAKNSIGVLRSSTGEWFIDRNANQQWDGCVADGCYHFGAPGDLPVAGDWTGTGFAKIGVFRNGQWYLDANGNGAWDGCGADLCFAFGIKGDLPVAGNWNGGSRAGVGVFRAGSWFLDANGNGAWDRCQQDGGLDLCHSFGTVGDLPAAGDWNGDGKAKVGVFRAGTWYLDYNGNGAWDGCGTDRCYVGSFGVEGDLPVAGKW